MGRNSCVITSGHNAFDDRIFHKECGTLAKEGYRVHLVAPHDHDETVGGVHVVCLPTADSRFVRMTKVCWLAFCRAWKSGAQIIHIHDPELILVGFLLKCLGKKVIYDVHENVPKQILSKEWLGSRGTRVIVAYLVNAMEKCADLVFDGIVAATPDIARRFRPSKTVTVRNMPIRRYIDVATRNADRDGHSVVVYSGGLSEIRGIKEIIQAMIMVPEEVELWLLGTWENEQFQRECAELQGWARCSYKGSFPYGAHYPLMKQAVMGTVIFLPEPNHLEALPNKPFEYMACGLPTVMSDFPYWREMFGECAVFADPTNPKDIAAKIKYLIDNPAEAKLLGSRGRFLIETQYNWEVESQKLLSLYGRLSQ